MMHFDKREFECPCCGGLPSIQFMRLIDEARGLAMIPFNITSGYRCPGYNKKVGGKKDSAHTNGKACDISCRDSRTRFKIINSALSCGITRIGVYERFIHLDIDLSKPQGVIWYG